mmetsp:Transcript_6841/g.26412  ORF Transcript_6841/g.26412 Transcript_6841/m.26412 type:complete len:216 (-) Transcript_6841:426-1073(-)
MRRGRWLLMDVAFEPVTFLGRELIVSDVFSESDISRFATDTMSDPRRCDSLREKPRTQLSNDVSEFCGKFRTSLGKMDEGRITPRMQRDRKSPAMKPPTLAACGTPSANRPPSARVGAYCATAAPSKKKHRTQKVIQSRGSAFKIKWPTCAPMTPKVIGPPPTTLRSGSVHATVSAPPMLEPTSSSPTKCPCTTSSGIPRNSCTAMFASRCPQPN